MDGFGIKNQHQILLKSRFYSLFINPIRAGGAESARTFFRWLFLHEKRGSEVQNFVTFPNSLLTFRKSKKKFLVFHSVFLGDLEAPIRTQATSRRPAQLGLTYVYLSLSLSFQF